MPVKALVFVATEPRKTRQAAEKLPQPWHVVTGRFDAVTFIQNETLKALGEQVVNQVRSQDGVSRTETYPILREVTKTARPNAPVSAYILVRTAPHKTEQVFGWLAGLGETSWAGLVSGRYDVAAQVSAQTWDELANLVVNRVRAVEGVNSTETFFVAQ